MAIHCRAVKNSLRGTILYTLSMCIRNWCVHWACASGADACTEHARQELIRTLSIRVRNWCVHWAYVLGTNVCTECIPFKKCWAYASGNDAYPEHTGQELMHSLNIRVRNWCVPWAYASVSYAYDSISIKILYLKRSLQSKLSMHIRNWCVHWACASGTDAQAQRAHQKLNDA